jgi:hypothetical protein
MMVVNVPTGNGANYQFIQNTITSAWTIFTGWDANCFEVMEDELYFGDSTGVRKAWQGNLDGENVITADVLPAFDEFGNPAQSKLFTLVRPYLSTDGSPSILYGLNTDYFAREVTGALSYTAPSAMTWGSMVWGSMVWGGSLSNITAAHNVGAAGRAAALRLVAQNNGSNLQWAATDFVFAPGGIL